MRAHPAQHGQTRGGSPGQHLCQSAVGLEQLRRRKVLPTPPPTTESDLDKANGGAEMQLEGAPPPTPAPAPLQAQNTPRAQPTQPPRSAQLSTIRKRGRFGYKSKAARAARMTKNLQHVAVKTNIKEIYSRRIVRKALRSTTKCGRYERLRNNLKYAVNQLQTTLDTCNTCLGENALQMQDVLSFWHLQRDPQLTQLMASKPQFRELKRRWEDAGTSSLLEYLTLNSDEALLLKENMMVSYVGWNEMRNEAHMQHLPGATALKDLAKTYNKHLETELGFNPVADGKGYGVDILKLHKWMIDRAIVLGFLLPNRIPRTIDYKLSIDGSNLGSRNCELVALTPMNLGYNPNSLHSIFPLMLYEGKERRDDLNAVLSPLNTQLMQL